MCALQLEGECDIVCSETIFICSFYLVDHDIVQQLCALEHPLIAENGDEVQSLTNTAELVNALLWSPDWGSLSLEPVMDEMTDGVSVVVGSLTATGNTVHVFRAAPLPPCQPPHIQSDGLSVHSSWKSPEKSLIALSCILIIFNVELFFIIFCLKQCL